jgi:hypothetical protein
MLTAAAQLQVQHLLTVETEEQYAARLQREADKTCILDAIHVRHEVLKD